MRKKGDVQVEPIVILSLFIIMLALLGLGYYLFYVREVTLLNYLPGFNQTQEKKEGVSIIAYDISQEKMQYYDGTSWIDFSGENIELERKIIDSGEVERYFFDLYLNNDKATTQRSNLRIDLTSSAREEFSASENANLFGQLKLIIAKEQSLSGEDILGDESKSYLVPGEVPIWIYDSNLNNEPYGMFILKLNNNLDFWIVGEPSVISFLMSNDPSVTTYVESTKPVYVYPGNDKIANKGENYQKIKTQATIWRDSVLEKPLNIQYTDSKSGKEVSDKYFCVEKYDSKLTLDLNKPVGAEEKC